MICCRIKREASATVNELHLIKDIANADIMGPVVVDSIIDSLLTMNSFSRITNADFSYLGDKAVHAGTVNNLACFGLTALCASA